MPAAVKKSSLDGNLRLTCDESNEIDVELFANGEWRWIGRIVEESIAFVFTSSEESIAFVFTSSDDSLKLRSPSLNVLIERLMIAAFKGRL